MEKNNLHLIECLKSAYGLTSDAELSRHFDLSVSTVAMWRKRGSVPKWAEYLCRLLRNEKQIPDPLAGLGDKERALVVALIQLLKQ